MESPLSALRRRRPVLVSYRPPPVGLPAVHAVPQPGGVPGHRSRLGPQTRLATTSGVTGGSICHRHRRNPQGPVVLDRWRFRYGHPGRAVPAEAGAVLARTPWIQGHAMDQPLDRGIRGGGFFTKNPRRLRALWPPPDHAGWRRAGRDAGVSAGRRHPTHVLPRLFAASASVQRRGSGTSAVRSPGGPSRPPRPLMGVPPALDPARAGAPAAVDVLHEMGSGRRPTRSPTHPRLGRVRVSSNPSARLRAAPGLGDGNGAGSAAWASGYVGLRYAASRVRRPLA